MKNQCIKVLFLASIVTMAVAAAVLEKDVIASTVETLTEKVPRNNGERALSETDPLGGDYEYEGDTENDTYVERNKSSSDSGIRKYIHSACFNKTGSNDTSDQIIVIAERSIECAQGNISFGALLVEAAGLDDERSGTEYLQKYCPQFQSMENCFTPVIVELQKCLNEPELELINSLISLHTEGINAVCRENGKILFDSYNACKHLEMAKRTSFKDVHSFSPQQCDELGQLRRCYLEQLQPFNLSRTIEVLDLHLWQEVKNSPCKDIPIRNFPLELLGGF